MLLFVMHTPCRFMDVALCYAYSLPIYGCCSLLGVLLLADKLQSKRDLEAVHGSQSLRKRQQAMPDDVAAGEAAAIW